MTVVVDTGTPPANRYTADAEERMALLREMASQFPHEAEPVLLTPSEIRVARGTSAAAIEKVAVFVQAAPEVGAVADTTELRDAIAFEQAYAGVRDEARAYARRVDMAIMRHKLKAARTARGVYRIAKGYATMAEGKAIRTHVADLKRLFSKPRRRKTVPPPVVLPPGVEPADGEPPVKK